MIRTIPGGEDRLAGRLAALSHVARLTILRRLGENSCCCCKDVVGGMNLAQSTVSQHLKVLVDAGLVVVRQEGQRSLYRIDGEALAEVAQALSALVSTCCPERSLACAEHVRPAAGDN